MVLYKLCLFTHHLMPKIMNCFDICWHFVSLINHAFRKLQLALKLKMHAIPYMAFSKPCYFYLKNANMHTFIKFLFTHSIFHNLKNRVCPKSFPNASFDLACASSHYYLLQIHHTIDYFSWMHMTFATSIRRYPHF